MKLYRPVLHPALRPKFKMSIELHPREFKVNVYTADFTDEEEVRRVEDAISSNLSVPLGRVRFFCYKPEIYSHLDIYNGNHFGADGKGIKPSLYTSKYHGDAKRERSERQPQVPW